MVIGREKGILVNLEGYWSIKRVISQFRGLFDTLEGCLSLFEGYLSLLEGRCLGLVDRRRS